MTNADRKELAFPYENPSTSEPPYEKEVPCKERKCLADFGWTQPSGSMYSSVNDLQKLISLMFRDDKKANGKE